MTTRTVYVPVANVLTSLYVELPVRTAVATETYDPSAFFTHSETLRPAAFGLTAPVTVMVWPDFAYVAVTFCAACTARVGDTDDRSVGVPAYLAWYVVFRVSDTVL